VRWPLRPRRRTLSGRVSLLALSVIAGWLVLLAAGFDFVVSYRVQQQLDDAVRIRAQAASATVRVEHGVILGVRESATDSELDSTIWVYSGRKAIQRAEAPVEAQRVADGVAASGGAFGDGADRRFYVLPIESGGHRAGSVVAAIGTEPYDETQQTAVVGSVVVAILLLCGAYPVLRLAASRALRPVARMTRQAADWSVTAPTQRFGSDQQYIEVSSLARTLDELLDRLSAVLRHERQLSAELSHELRTPLARVLAEAELMMASADASQRASLQSIQTDCRSMNDIIDTLLAAARTELVRTVGHADLDPVLKSLAAQSRSPAVVAADTDLSVGIDPDLVTRILAPIVDNGRRFARTQVRLVARRAEADVAIHVTNDGPPVPAELAETIFEPGFSASPNNEEHSGAGLGLALARRLARAADGDLFLDIGSSATTFVLTLPAG
jgi:signal transduction histidine kinase